MRSVNTLQYHLDVDDVPAWKYVRARHIELANSLAGRKKLYLDTRFWILFRDVVLGRNTDRSLGFLLDCVREAVRSKRVICPVSWDSFSEIFVQNDPDTLKATVDLCDELSEGVCLTELHTRIDAELYHFVVQKTKGDDAVYRLDELVWTRCGYVMGYVSPQMQSIPESVSRSMEKVFFDQMWVAEFADLFEHLGCRPEWKAHTSSTDQLHEGKIASAGEFNSFKQLFMIELAGALDGVQESLSRILSRLYRETFGDEAAKKAQIGPAGGKDIANLIYHAFRLNKLEDELPTLRTHVTLHAALRWHRQRRYRPNDLADLRHAALALPYCDVFLTEKSLCHLVHEKHLGLTTRFRCRTFADPEAAGQHLQSLVT